MNQIHFLTTDTGTRIDSFHVIKSHCIEFFHNLLGSSERPPQFMVEDIRDFLIFRCTADQRTCLDALFSPEEIKETFFTFFTILLNFSRHVGV